MNTFMNSKKRRLTAKQKGWAYAIGRPPWKRVSFASDCGIDDDGEPLEECSLCGDSYAECECPGPTHDDFEYTTIKGILYARPA